MAVTTIEVIKVSAFVNARDFHRSLIFQGKAKSLIKINRFVRVAPALLGNIRLGRNCLDVTNALAYHTVVLITAAKSVIELAQKMINI
jgi:hypothetical protein